MANINTVLMNLIGDRDDRQYSSFKLLDIDLFGRNRSSPHPLAPSPKFGGRGIGVQNEVSGSLSQTWERAGVRARSTLNEAYCNDRMIQNDSI
jgi:hypothetical protein